MFKKVFSLIRELAVICDTNVENRLKPFSLNALDLSFPIKCMIA